MAGQARKRKFEQLIEDIGEDHPIHPDWVVFDLLAEGLTMEEVASEFRGFLDGDPDFPSRSWMYVWIHAGGEEREQRWAKAKEIAGHNLREDSTNVLKSGDPEDTDLKQPATGAEQAWRRDLANDLKDHARQLNPDEYAEKSDQPQVQLSIGELHLDALRKAGSMDASRQIESNEEQDLIEADAEVVE